MSTSSAMEFVDLLDADWKHTTASGRGRRALRTWSTHTDHAPTFASFSTLDEIIAQLHRSAPADSDPILYALIGLAQAGDEIAGRLVLQSFAGLAVQLSTGRRDSDYLRDVCGVLAEQIAIFPLDTRPTGVAQHLAFMVRRKLYRWRRRATLTTVPLDDNIAVIAMVDPARSADCRTAADRVAAVVRDARAQGGIDDDQARLLLSVAAGHRVASLARQAGCHRSRMGARLAKATAAANAYAVAA